MTADEDLLGLGKYQDICNFSEHVTLCFLAANVLNRYVETRGSIQDAITAAAAATVCTGR